MARKNFRGGRIGEEIRRIISDLLLRELKDPRFGGMVSITSVKASDDGTFATVYYTMLGSADAEPGETEKADAEAAFEKARGLIRHELAVRLSLRHTPDLRFKYDETEEYGRHIEKIIGSLGLPPAERPMNTLSELADALTEAESILIFPHENMDGDTLGSAVALCLALREQGKDSYVVINEKIADNIAFIESGCTIRSDDAAYAELFDDFDLAILIDVSETNRLAGRDVIFERGRKSMCIDHHVSSKPIYDYNLIDTLAAAVAEVTYDLLDELGTDIGEQIATAIYVGLVTDTGRFQFANTTPRSHQIAAELLDLGVQPNRVSTEIYHSMRLEKLYLENSVMNTTISVRDGRALIAHLTQAMLEESGALEEETEGLAEKLRSFRGVEVSVFLRETADGRTKASMRSKDEYDVAALAQRFGGGGHVRAAGFTSAEPLKQIEQQILSILTETL
ncbi:MAG: 30S ribosome-binding factor RbfA [Clostridiales Family XIII bacterium]|jgi:phosphoesterase RecJ-like protein|nr:30S ribosome-binding factor RbfA [Clostridiales Family XIII bacterium]